MINIKNQVSIKPTCLREFMFYMPLAYDFVAKKLIPAELLWQFIIVMAPVKSGKRIIKIIRAIMDQDGMSGKLTKAIHIYLTALNRKDIRPQLEEMERFGICCVVATNPLYEGIMNIIEKYEKDFDEIIIHFDESDYGTAINETIAKTGFFESIGQHPKIKLILYSATNEEALYSNLSKKACILSFDPGPYYRGAKWSLKRGLVFEATPFWDADKKELTPQAKQILEDFSNQPKPIGQVRLAANKIYPLVANRGPQSKEFRDILRAYNIIPKFIDQHTDFNWGTEADGTASSDWLPYADAATLKCLFIVNQTCTRSTEMAFHKHLYFMHDYTNGETCYNTIAQRDLRGSHFIRPEIHKEDLEKDPDFGHEIKIYTKVCCIKYAGGYITAEELTTKYGISLSLRVPLNGNRSKIESYDRIHLEYTVDEWLNMAPIQRWKEIKHLCPDNTCINGITEWVGCNSPRVGKYNTMNVASWILPPNDDKAANPQSSHYTKGIVQVIVVDEKSQNSNYDSTWERVIANNLIGKVILCIPHKNLNPIIKGGKNGSGFNNV